MRFPTSLWAQCPIDALTDKMKLIQTTCPVSRHFDSQPATVPTKREASLHLSMCSSNRCFSMRLEAKNIKSIIATHPEPIPIDRNKAPSAFHTIRTTATMGSKALTISRRPSHLGLRGFMPAHCRRPP